MMKKKPGGMNMESNQNLQSVLEQLEQSSRKQVRYARIQCFFTIAAAVFCLILLITVSSVIPRVTEIAGQVNTLALQAETVLTNLESVTAQLAQADLAGMVANVDALAVSSQAGMEQALEKISAIDIEALNEAIQKLSDVVTPLANLMKRWG